MTINYKDDAKTVRWPASCPTRAEGSDEMNAPRKITAWVNPDGSTQFAGDKLFPKGVEAEYIREDLNRRLQDTLEELVTCVEDGCYCSEMRMASAIDEAKAALRGMPKGKTYE